MELIVVEPSGHFEVDIPDNHSVLIWAPRGIKDWSMPKNAGFSVFEWGADSIYIQADQGFPVGTEVGLRGWSDGFEFSLYLRAVDELRKVEDAYVVKPAADKRRENHRTSWLSTIDRAIEVAARVAEHQKTYAVDDGDDPSVVLARDRLARYKPPRLQAEFEVIRLNQHAPEVSILECEWLRGRDLLMTFDAVNPGIQPLSLDAISAHDASGELIEVQPVFDTRPEDQEQGRIHTLQARERMRAGVILENAITRELEGMQLYFRGTVAAQSAVTANRVIRFRPVPEGDLEQERQDREARGRVTIQVQPMYGVMWLANPLLDGQLDSTSLRGLGVRASYGVNRLFALEGEIVGASSGNARFDGMTFQNMEGIVTRNARLGRVLIGGVASMGYRYVPTLRLGIGFQGADSATRFVPATGGEVAGPDVGFEIAAFFSFGAGLDLRLGKHWRVGAHGAYSQSIGATSRSLEIGVHLGYGWTPGGVVEPPSYSPVR